MVPQASYSVGSSKTDRQRRPCSFRAFTILCLLHIAIPTSRESFRTEDLMDNQPPTADCDVYHIARANVDLGKAHLSAALLTGVDTIELTNLMNPGYIAQYHTI